MISPVVSETRFTTFTAIGCYLVDFGFSAAAAFQLGQKMRSLEKTWGEFMKYLQKSRFNQLAEEMNAKVQQYRAEYRTAPV